MKKIAILNLTRLRTEEAFGYLKQILAETANLPAEETPAAQTAAVNAGKSTACCPRVPNAADPPKKICICPV